MFKPTTFGKFFLYEKLAIGGMAEIFKAKLYGIAGFEKTLVVKQILPEYANDNEFVKMFIDEANIAVSLTHGNIVPVYELGKIADRYYIAMEYVDGENLETIVDQVAKMHREIPIHLCVEIVIEVCKGLDYAHRRTGADGASLGIVHRDVSPQNVMVSFDGEVKIVDFGIAKAASKLSLTRVGTLKGKFGYMSPEQAMGNEVDRRTDVYAAGIVLYEILTGRKLYDAENDLDLLKKVRAGQVAPPSTFNRAVPPELDRLVLRALARDINARYQYASEFQGDLQRWLYSRPADPSEETLSNFMRGLFRRDPGRVAAAPPPVPAAQQSLILEQFEESAEDTDDVPTTPDSRSRRDVSYAQNDEIAKMLEQASREARRVMGEEVSEDHTIAHEESQSHPTASPLEDRPTIPPRLEDRPTSRPQSDGYGVDEAVTHTASSGADELIEFDETTSAAAQRLQPASSVVERPNVEGPIVRIPRRAKVLGANAPAPPWQDAEAPLELASAPERPTARRKSKPLDVSGVASSPVIAVSVQDGPSVQRSITRPAVSRRLRFAVYAMVALGALAVLAVGLVRHVMKGTAGSATPAPTAVSTIAATATGTATAAAAGSRGTAAPSAVARESATATPPATIATQVALVTTTPPPATPPPTPAAPSTRRATFETTPSGAAVYVGSKRVGTTPVTVTVAAADDLSVRYTRSGYRELKRSYPGAATPLKASETLELIPTPTPTPRPPPVEYGSVSVNATPWGRVKIDGAFVKNTPVIKHKLKTGTHEIEVSNPDFPRKTQKKSVVVHANVDEDPIIVTFE